MKLREEHFAELIHELAICYLTECIGTEILNLPDPEGEQENRAKKKMQTVLYMLEGGDCKENRDKLNSMIREYSEYLIGQMPSFINIGE